MPINFTPPPSQKGSAVDQRAMNQQPVKAKPIEVGKKYGRNDKVTISNGSETKVLKYKKAESLIAEGWNIVD